MELYLKVRLARSEGMSQRELARHFNISRDSVRLFLATQTDHEAIEVHGRTDHSLPERRMRSMLPRGGASPRGTASWRASTVVCATNY